MRMLWGNEWALNVDVSDVTLTPEREELSLSETLQLLTCNRYLWFLIISLGPGCNGFTWEGFENRFLGP